MAKSLRTPADLLGHTIRDEKVSKYTYARFFRAGGSIAKKGQREGKRMKANDRIRN